jgi:uncharacterized membrane protein
MSISSSTSQVRRGHHDSPAQKSGERRLVSGLLLLILLAGFVLRVWHIDWADGQLPHPDERSTVAYYAPSIQMPPEGVSLLDKRQSPLNPLWNVQDQERRSYTYGHFPLYLLVLAANAFHAAAPLAEQLGAPAELVETLRTANGVPGFAIVGRLLMAIGDTVTVLFVYLLAERTYRRRDGRRAPWVGLLAAAFSAFTVLQIQLSHFFAVDPISTTFTAMALYGALRMAEGRNGWAIFTGIGAGLAIASKFSALPILAAPITAGLLFWWQQRRTHPSADSAFIVHRSSFIVPAALLALLALAVALLTFAITSPFAILDWANFSHAVLTEQGAMVRGAADFPFTRQYRGTIPFLYQIEQLVRWGIGWPLGLLAFASFAWALVKLLIGRARPGEWIILSWVVPYFVLTGLFLAKFIRYMVPVTPFLMVFAAGLIAAIWARGEAKEGKRGKAGEEVRPGSGSEGQEESGVAQDQPASAHRSSLWHWLAAGMAAVALLGAILWSLAYVNGVYNNTHPWIKASRWIYANIPDGSTIAWEQWDDSLPYDLPEPSSHRGRYHFIDWGPFEEDTAEKFERLKATLREADVLALSSNRIYGAVDNLPERYPMTNRYYQLLFDGQLGFELALEEFNSPGLLGIAIDDRSADESFTLYDHPRVLVFRKVRDLSDAEWDALLGGSWQGARPWYVGEETFLQRIWPSGSDKGSSEGPKPEPGPGQGKSLLLAEPVDQLPVVQDFRWNQVASASTPLAVLVWWLAVSLLGWAAWPITFGLFRSLHDRGYLLARSLGWLLLGWLVWIGASLRVVQFRTPVVFAALGLIALLSLLLWLRQRAAMAQFWRQQKRLVLGGEALFAAAFLLFVLFRIANPDIWQPWNGGEKFMEFAFLNAILRSPYFPPLDPYFAGGVINYYYYGLYLVAVLVKLTGIASSVAFNLAIPTVFALAVVNVWSLAFNLALRLQPSPPAPLPGGEGSQRARPASGSPLPVGEGLGVRAYPADGSPPPTDGSPLPASGSPLPGGEGPGVRAHSAADSPPPASGSPLPLGEGLGVRAHSADDSPPPTDGSPLPPGEGLGVRVRPAALTALLAAFFVAMLGNVDGGGQMVRKLADLSSSSFESNLPGVQTAVRAAGGLLKVLGPEKLPSYNYWDPSRVIPNTINEFPYWSFLFADLHPHMIGIGFTVLFLALLWSLLVGASRRPAPAMADSARAWAGYVVRAATGDGLYLVLALALGALAVINTWDLPTYFGLAVLIWLMREWQAGRLVAAPLQALVRTGLFAAGLLGGALLLYLPFFANYQALASSGVGVTPQASELGKWLNMWGFFGFLAVSFVLVELRRRGSRYGEDAYSTSGAGSRYGEDAYSTSGAGSRYGEDAYSTGGVGSRYGEDACSTSGAGSRYGEDAYSTGGAGRDPLLLRWLRVALNHLAGLGRLVELTPRLSLNALLAIGVAVAAAVALLAVQRAVAAVLLLPLLAAFLLLWRHTRQAEVRFVSALVFTGLLVLFGVELFYLKDHLQGGDWRRMNTLFKFYIQVWVMLGLAVAVALPGIWDFIRRRWQPVWRVLWLAVFGYLLFLSLVFLVLGTPMRLDDRFPARGVSANRPPVGTLDGMAYMQAGVYTWHPDPGLAASTPIELRYDYDALRWMLDNVEGAPVVAEALIGYYREGGLRVASFTGFPTLLGFHQEGEQRYGWQTGPRRSLAEEFWNSTDIARTQQLIAELGIDYIYVGQLERIVYPAESLAKFEQMAQAGTLQVVYANDQVTIYRVNDE